MATKHVVTGDQYRIIDRRMNELKRQLNQEGGSPLDPEAVAGQLQLIIEGGLTDNFIEVPALSASDLIAQAEKAINTTYLNPDLAIWDFYKNQKGMIVDQGGKRYEVMTWAPGRSVSTEEVRNHFPKGFHGNTAAFVAWVMKHQPHDWSISIPEDDRLWSGPDGLLCAPGFRHGDQHRGLGLNHVGGAWGDGGVFVAFREVLP